MAKIKLSPEMLELRDVMQTRSGRSVMTRLLSDLGYWADTFHPDPMQHAKLSGARSAAVTLVTDLERDMPELWTLLLSERLNKNNNPTERTEEHDDRDDD